MRRENIPPPNDCPVCNKKHGATFGSSEWGHSITCCSNKCGLEMKERLIKLRKSRKMKKLQKKLDSLKGEILATLQNVTGDDSYFEERHWL